MKALVQYTLRTILLLFLIVSVALASVKKQQPPRIDLRIDLEWTVDELLANAPTKLPDDYGPDSTLRTFLLYNVDPRLTYQGKEVSFKGARSTFLTYQYGVPVSIRLNNLDGHTKTLPEIKEKLKILLPTIDALGFNREKGNEKFSVENFPLPKKYIPKKGSSIGWVSDDQLKILRLIITTPVNPEIYTREKRYFLSFVYYDETDESILKENWLKKRSSNKNG